MRAVLVNLDTVPTPKILRPFQTRSSLDTHVSMPTPSEKNEFSYPVDWRSHRLTILGESPPNNPGQNTKVLAQQRDIMADKTSDDDSLYRLAEMTWPQVKRIVEDSRTPLVPMGSTEQHGHHLPLRVDGFMPEGIAERIARRTGYLLAPPIWYGVTPHHTFKPGTFTIESETF